MGVVVCAPQIMLGQRGRGTQMTFKTFRPSLQGEKDELVVPTQDRWLLSAL